MKYKLLMCAVLCTGLTFAQSKKKQLEVLSLQIDSMQRRMDSLTTVNKQITESLRQLTIDLNESTYENGLMRSKSIQQEIIIDALNYKVDRIEKASAKIDEAKKSKDAKTPGYDPFGGGINWDKLGGGTSEKGGFGSDSGPGSNAPVQLGKGRTRLNDVTLENIDLKEDATIHYKLTVDSEGSVVLFNCNMGKTTTTDQMLINKIGNEIKKQVKYSKSPDGPLVYIEYTLRIKGT